MAINMDLERRALQQVYILAAAKRAIEENAALKEKLRAQLQTAQDLVA